VVTSTVVAIVMGVVYLLALLALRNETARSIIAALRNRGNNDA
jgi:hypothetical protein